MVSTEFPDSVKVDNDEPKKWQNMATIAVTKITFLLFLCRRGWLLIEARAGCVHALRLAAVGARIALLSSSQRVIIIRYVFVLNLAL